MYEVYYIIIYPPHNINIRIALYEALFIFFLLIIFFLLVKKDSCLILDIDRNLQR